MRNPLPRLSYNMNKKYQNRENETKSKMNSLYVFRRNVANGSWAQFKVPIRKVSNTIVYFLFMRTTILT